jgi:hypothetical protein
MDINIVNSLDRIASRLEEKGLVKEAEKLDVISNTFGPYLLL